MRHLPAVYPYPNWMIGNSHTDTSMIRCQHSFFGVFKSILVTFIYKRLCPCGLRLMAIMAAVALPSYSKHFPLPNYGGYPSYSGHGSCPPTLHLGASGRGGIQLKSGPGITKQYLHLRNGSVSAAVSLWEYFNQSFCFSSQEPSELFSGPLIIT